MLTQTIGRFENAEDLIDWLKSYGYEKILRTFPDGVILESGEESVLVSTEDSLVAFSSLLEEEDLEYADENGTLESLVLQEYGSGGCFWFPLDEIVVCGVGEDDERLCLLNEFGTFFREYID